MSKKIKFSKNYNCEKQQLIEAIERKDVTAINSVCNKLDINRSDLLETIGDEWLIYLSSKEAVDWFWLLFMEPEEYCQMINGLIGQAINLLLDAGYKPNEDFQTIDCNGECCISFLSQKAQNTLINLVPSEHQQQIYNLFQQSNTKCSSLRK